MICCGCYTAYNRGCFNLQLHLTSQLTGSDLVATQNNFARIADKIYDYVTRSHTNCKKNDSAKFCKHCRFNKMVFTLYHLVFVQDFKQKLLTGLQDFLQKYWSHVSNILYEKWVKSGLQDKNHRKNVVKEDESSSPQETSTAVISKPLYHCLDGMITIFQKVAESQSGDNYFVNISPSMKSAISISIFMNERFESCKTFDLKTKNLLKILPLPFTPGNFVPKSKVVSGKPGISDGNVNIILEKSNNFLKRHFFETTEYQKRDKLLRKRILEILMLNAWKESSYSSELEKEVISEIEKTAEIICVECYFVGCFMRLWTSYDQQNMNFRMSPYGTTTVSMSTVFSYFTTEYGMDYAEHHMRNTVRISSILKNFDLAQLILMNFYLLIRLSVKVCENIIQNVYSKCLLKIICQKLEEAVHSIKANTICDEIFGIVSEWHDNQNQAKKFMRKIEVEMASDHELVLSFED